MDINFFQRILKAGISLFILYIFELNTINKQAKVEKNLIAASEKDLLYRQMGASYLYCFKS